MTEQRKPIVSWGLKLILLGGGILGLALGALGQPVNLSDRKAKGASPISRFTPAEKQEGTTAARMENNLVPADTIGLLTLPAIDRVATKETEFALFALG